MELCWCNCIENHVLVMVEQCKSNNVGGMVLVYIFWSIYVGEMLMVELCRLNGVFKTVLVE